MFTLRAPSKALAIGLLKAPEPALKGFQDGPGDLPAARQVALRRPGQKEFEDVTPVFHRGRRVIAHGQRFQVAVQLLPFQLNSLRIRRRIFPLYENCDIH